MLMDEKVTGNWTKEILSLGEGAAKERRAEERLLITI